MFLKVLKKFSIRNFKISLFSWYCYYYAAFVFASRYFRCLVRTRFSEGLSTHSKAPQEGRVDIYQPYSPTKSTAHNIIFACHQKKKTYDIHWYIPETVSSPFSLKACSINSVYVNGGFLAFEYRGDFVDCPSWHSLICCCCWS